MSQAINTGAIPTREIAPPSRIRYTASVLGVAIAGLLGYGAALVATGHLPWIGHQVASPVAAEATPETRSGAVSSGVVDPFEAQFATVAAQAAVGVVGATSLEAVTHSALDPFELRSTSPGSSSAAASGGSLAHGALDPFELRSASATIEAGSGSIVAQSGLDPFELRSGTEPGTDTGPPATPMSGTDHPRPAFE